jgi:polysaccharide biosynthesis protein PelF
VHFRISTIGSGKQGNWQVDRTRSAPPGAPKCDSKVIDTKGTDNATVARTGPPGGPEPWFVEFEYAGADAEDLVMTALHEFTVEGLLPFASIDDEPSFLPAVSTRSDFDVLLVAEGTYPFHFGGVSTWCHLLIESLPDVRFHVMALSADASTPLRFTMAPNVVDYRPTPLWGLLDPAEVDQTYSIRRMFRRRRTRPSAVERDFVPAFLEYLTELFGADSDPARLASAIHAMYRFLSVNDFGRVARSEVVWEAFRSFMIRAVPELGARHGYHVVPTLYELSTAFTVAMHGLFTLSRPLPDVDVVHTAMAGTCTLVAAAVKLEYGAGFLLSEHGVYLRESYLALADGKEGIAAKVLNLAFARRMTTLTYFLADQISPCCDYNQRWEVVNGADRNKLRTIYYGVDSELYRPEPRDEAAPLTVVWAGRINPLKDLETLIGAAAVVHADMANVKFHLYGSAAAEDEEYYARCLELRAELGLEDVVEFKGFSDRTQDVFNSGDVVALTSISEGFPYSTLEAMLCGKAVVATAVGGLSEQLGDSGVLVEPRRPDEFGKALLTVLRDDELRGRLGRGARERACTYFDVDQCAEAFLDTYRRLSDGPVDSGANDDEFCALARVFDMADRIAPGATAERTSPELAWRATPAAVVGTEVRGLVELASSRLCNPIDAQEVSAFLESTGVTDVTARARYRAADVFELGRTVLEALRFGPTAELRVPSPPNRQRKTGFKPAMLSVQTMLLVVVTYASVQVLRWLGGWTPGRTLGMSLGVSGAVLMAGGLMSALVRRVSIYTSLERPAALRAQLKRALLTAAILAVGVGGVGVGVSLLVGSPETIDLATALMAFGAVSAVWMTSGELALLERPWVGISSALGLGVLIGVDRALEASTDHHLAFAAATGVSVVLGINSLGLARACARLRDQPSGRREPNLPNLRFWLAEATPYMAVTMLSIAVVVISHLLGWIGPRVDGLSLRQSRDAYTIAMVAALLPLVLCASITDSYIRSLWVNLVEVIERAPADQHGIVATELRWWLGRARWRYATSMIWLSNLALAGFLFARHLGWLDHLEPGDGGVSLTLVFVLALLGYFLLGLGQLNLALPLTLARPRMVIPVMMLALMVTVVAGVALALLWMPLAAGGLVAGAAVQYLGTHRLLRDVMASSDYFLVTSF